MAGITIRGGAKQAVVLGALAAVTLYLVLQLLSSGSGTRPKQTPWGRAEQLRTIGEGDAAADTKLGVRVLQRW
jgi:hypothetical protein